MNFIEVVIRAKIDSGELVAMLDSIGSWEEDSALRLYWPEDKWTPAALADLRTVLKKLGIQDEENVLTISSIPDRDWNAEWTASLSPIRLGRRFWVRQSWHSVDPEFSGFEIVIDPKRAFGTGYHVTTQLVIEWLEDHIRGGERVLDVGTGTGILAMAAIRLGAASALGVDNDPVALECAREYCEVNGFGPELQLRVCSFEELAPADYDVLVANLDIRTMPKLCPHLPRLLKPGGRACLSGLMQPDLDEVSEALSHEGLKINSRTQREEWFALGVLAGSAGVSPAFWGRS